MWTPLKIDSRRHSEVLRGISRCGGVETPSADLGVTWLCIFIRNGEPRLIANSSVIG
ncbi:MAG: hypothetical protein BWY79_01586 [Actinobacteria bacterium ADurb.Bin444]|nr:MAG: hypothetical protein BWY79_01586 [Actinobacteria bacterium ADurb.Bin444]